MTDKINKKERKKFVNTLENHEDFLVEALRKDWAEAERLAKRAELVRNLKACAKTTVKSLLVLMVLAGVVTVAAVAPNVFAAFGRAKKYRKFYNKEEFRESVRYLKSKKYINVGRRTNDYSLTITDYGKKFIYGDLFRKLRITRRHQWDGYWRLVMFDIPNDKKTARDAFRLRLKALGLFQLQKSVFAFPDTCSEEVSFLSNIYNVSSYITLAETKLISDDRRLRAYFGV